MLVREREQKHPLKTGHRIRIQSMFHNLLPTAMQDGIPEADRVRSRSRQMMVGFSPISLIIVEGTCNCCLSAHIDTCSYP
ncbi:hypothetical protein ASPFODRAFT_662091 [Aspergillus luchuensis CBS 106.47]|uniref:Uncharacterized protein n=1 Tax=Aspergillus luchuensis (strain CBS 106.47) TaxID=1137211 RepID=A0A1M3TF55_ASPLC|nr:hypothetical protein ASPFODRAFT_662091 [Aspergillus luchuensis CBS 106.47]